MGFLNLILSRIKVYIGSDQILLFAECENYFIPSQT